MRLFPAGPNAAESGPGTGLGLSESARAHCVPGARPLFPAADYFGADRFILGGRELRDCFRRGEFFFGVLRGFSWEALL